MATRVDFHGRLDGKKRTPQGGLRLDANLTRTGIFLYRDARGAPVREYRPPSEVFNADSLESLKLAPLTVGHPDMVRTDNFRELAVGMVAENVRKRDRFVASDVLVQDQETIDAIEDGSLVELSCGYEVDLEFTPGVTPEGEHYDAVQRNIRYNHVGLGGPGWGRAGSDVALHLDGKDGIEDAVRLDEAGNVFLEHYSSATMAMTAEEKARLDKAEADRDTAKLEADKAKAKADAAEAELAKLKADSGKLVDPSTIPAIVAARVSLESSARDVLGPEFKAEKTDAKGKVEPMTDAEIVAAVLAKADPSLKIDGRSSDYLRARFDGAVESARKAIEAHGAFNANSAAPDLEDSTKKKADAADANDPLGKAIEDFNARTKADSKAGPPRGAVTRK